MSKLSVGGIFRTRAEAVDVIQAVALSQNRRAIVNKKRSGGSQFIYICNSSTPCTFEIVLAKSRRKVPNHIVVKSLSLAHDNCTGTAKARRKDVTSKPVAQNAVNANMRISGASLQYQVKADAGIDLNKRTPYRVIDDLVQLKYGNFEAGYKKVASFLEEFATKNPTSFTAFEARDGNFIERPDEPTQWKIQPNCHSTNYMEERC
uniref:Transposase MuDR plant domain-containing protein n=1 Tax=Globisporangium ultimum (strain ATCC 200006 / CBS 805.95 / DAOM BR144) TaxID=431595 RepID=K3XDK4_GLOUD